MGHIVDMKEQLTAERLRWHASIRRAGVRRHLGYHATAAEAHKAWCAAAREMFGDFFRAA
jgi:hypothetical protein